MSHIPPHACVGLREQQARELSISAWNGVTVQQLGYFSWGPFGEISASTLKTFVSNYKLELVNKLTVTQTFMYPLDAAAGNLANLNYNYAY